MVTQTVLRERAFASCVSPQTSPADRPSSRASASATRRSQPTLRDVLTQEPREDADVPGALAAQGARQAGHAREAQGLQALDLRRKRGSDLGQLALQRLLAALDHAAGCPERGPASATQPPAPR
eukprot:scaffold44595_cov69-Phaeocystis_antarctica.AAC.1